MWLFRPSLAWCFGCHVLWAVVSSFWRVLACFPVLLATSFLALLEGFRRHVRQPLNASLWLLRRSFTGIFWAAVSSFGCALQPCWPRRFQLLHVTVYTPHSTPYTFYSTPYLTLYARHSALYTLHFTLSRCTLHFTLHTLQSPLHTLHTTFLTQHSTFFALHPCFIFGVGGRQPFNNIV